MSLPQFTAEAALKPALGVYRANARFVDSPGGQISPTQEFTGAASAITRSCPRPWEKLTWCCYYYFGRIYCNYSCVPIWWSCINLTPNGPSCWSCHPGGVLEP